MADNSKLLYPIFIPAMTHDERAHTEFHYGMTLREFYAGQAMKSLVEKHGIRYPETMQYEGIAHHATRLADALIAELNK